MAAIKAFGATDQGQWIGKGKDKGKPVRYRIRPVTQAADRECRRQIFGQIKGRSLGRQTAAAVLDRTDSLTLERAVYALVDTENFSLEVGDAASAAHFGKLLGQELTVGAEVLLDGKWSPDLRREVLILVPRLFTWISEQSDKIVAAGFEDDEEDTQDF